MVTSTLIIVFIVSMLSIGLILYEVDSEEEIVIQPSISKGNGYSISTMINNAILGNIEYISSKLTILQKTDKEKSQFIKDFQKDMAINTTLNNNFSIQFNNLSLYNDKNISISFYYPTSWNIINKYNQNSLVTFQLPLQNNDSKFKPRVGIYFHSLENIPRIQMIGPYILKLIYFESLVESIKKQNNTLKHNISVSGSQDNSLNNFLYTERLNKSLLESPFWGVIYNNNNNVTALEIFTIKDRKVYVIFYLASDNDFYNLYLDVIKMIRSFTISYPLILQ